MDFCELSRLKRTGNVPIAISMGEMMKIAIVANDIPTATDYLICHLYQI
jgi:DNA polymerase III psi subunit